MEYYLVIMELLFTKYYLVRANKVLISTTTWMNFESIPGKPLKTLCKFKEVRHK